MSAHGAHTNREDAEMRAFSCVSHRAPVAHALPVKEVMMHRFFLQPRSHRTSTTAWAAAAFVVSMVVTAPAASAAAHTPGDASASHAQAAGRAPWEVKLTPALQAAAEANPDAVLRIRVGVAPGQRVGKARDLATFGFTVHSSDAADAIVLSATAREAMVLAEDPEIATLALDVVSAVLVTDAK
jgi:hypothetical protein